MGRAAERHPQGGGPRDRPHQVGSGHEAQPPARTCRRRGGCCYEKAEDGKVTCCWTPEAILRPPPPPPSSCRGWKGLREGHGEPFWADPMAEPTRPPLSLPRGWERRAGACSVALGQRLSLPPSSPRLIKGDGEVLEEIVTKERHREINKVGVAPSPRARPPLCL